MHNRNELISVNLCGKHKGFYNDDDFLKSLTNIKYDDFFECPDDEEFLCYSAYVFLS